MGQWKWNLMEDWLPAVLLQKVAATLPPSEEHGKDERVIAGGDRSQFTVSGMYMKLCGYDGAENNSNWKKIWSINVPERVRTFIWMMLHGRLLTNVMKNKMGLSHAMCSFCRTVEETILHVMRDCPKANELWRGVIPGIYKVQFYMGDLNQWINFNFSNAIQWNVTNKISMIGWTPPRDLFVKLNTDGAYKEHVVAGCGGLIRGSQEEWLGGFAKCVGLCSAFVAELWGVYEGLRYAHRLGFRRVELHSDSVAVVRVLKKGSSTSING
ncbi:putative non-LTR retroelement reverse transcriptase, partial [Trifolium medium]|nr:putative non-LTR retroelement reverse transcriptase [Trifolium medium]